MRRKRRGRGMADLINKAKKINSVLRQHKLISRSAGALASALHGTKGGNIAGTIHAHSSAAGYGKRRRRRGKGKVWDWIKGKAIPFLKKTKIVSGISGALANVGGPVGTVAGLVNKGATAAGLGRKRHRRPVRGTGHRVRRHVRHRRGMGIGPQLGSGFGGSLQASSGRVVF